MRKFNIFVFTFFFFATSYLYSQVLPSHIIAYPRYNTIGEIVVKWNRASGEIIDVVREISGSAPITIARGLPVGTLSYIDDNIDIEQKYKYHIVINGLRPIQQKKHLLIWKMNGL